MTNGLQPGPPPHQARISRDESIEDMRAPGDQDDGGTTTTIALGPLERRLMKAVAAHRPSMRRWRRYSAAVLLAEGRSPKEVAAALNCDVLEVMRWAHLTQLLGPGGLGRSPVPGRAPLLDDNACRLLETLLHSAPPPMERGVPKWTLALLLAELDHAGYVVSRATLRRALHRSGWYGGPDGFIRTSPDVG